MANAQHLAKSAEHGTPVDVVEAARSVLGKFDLDPASNVEHNKIVKADWFYTAEQDGLAPQWYGHVFLNPPGTCGLLVCGNKKVCSCQLVRKFWNKLIHEYLAGRVRSAIWIGFSLEQLASLQNKTEKSPLSFPLCYPRKRLKFRGDNPTHSNYIALLPDCRMDGGMQLGLSQTALFQTHFAKFGVVRVPA